MKLLILGGYGVFGGRLIELLSDLSDIEIWVAGRTLAKATNFCSEYNGSSKVYPYCTDRANISDAIKEIRPDLIVDASGPFQDYGDDKYLVAHCAIASGADYLDFADGAEFAFGISILDNSAKKAGVFALSGVSSFPVLTGAVLREMEKQMKVERLTGGIAPSPFAGIGLNVMRAVLGYAGQNIKLTRNGAVATGKGLVENKRFTIAPEGKVPLRNIRFSLVDVPDLQILPKLHPDLKEIWMGAGPVPEILHRCLNTVARIRSWKLLPNLTVFSKLFYWVLNKMKFGENRGGMFLRAEGGGEVLEWHLLAEGKDGPMIPSMAIEGIIRNLLNGKRPNAGARVAQDEIGLDTYSDLTRDREIYFGFRSHKNGPIFQTLLGETFNQLPQSVKDFHTQAGKNEWQGRAKVTRGKGLLSRLVSSLYGFPSAGADIPVSVNVEANQDHEYWQRDFADRVFHSKLSLGDKRNQFLMVEKFGPIKVSLALEIVDKKLFFKPRRWSFLGFPLPRFLIPEGGSFEYEEDGQFRFDVKLALPIIGLIVAYKGWLEPVT